MKKPELIFIPSPGIGHIVSTVEMAKLLISRDQNLSITFLIMNLPRDTKINSYIKSISSNSNTTKNIQFIDLPQPDMSSLSTINPNTFLPQFIEIHKTHVRDAVSGRLNSDNLLVGFVIDMFCTTMIDVANEFNLPTYMFFTSSATFCSLLLHVENLVHNENLEISEIEGGLDVPGFANRVPVGVLPSVFFDKEGGLEMALTIARRFKETKGIIINTFYELEPNGIESLLNGKNLQIYPVGPILNLENEGDSNKNDIIEWLDEQSESSVVFLCFGSMGSFDKEQVKEIAKALERSGHRFLWSLRRPVEKGKIELPGEFSDPAEVLPDGFLERSKILGKVVGWVPQVNILSHKSVAGFVSHCGWNSSLESVWCGVPIATWPMYAEQQINAFHLLKELGLGVEIKMDYRTSNGEIVSGEVIESGIRKLMEENENECGVRKKMREMKERSRMAVKENGSSYKTMGTLIEDIMKNIQE